MNVTSVTSDEDCVGPKLAPFNPTNNDAINIVLSLLQLRPSDVFYDLGCGDARLLIQASKKYDDIKIIGIEYDRSLWLRALNNLAAYIQESNISDENIVIKHNNVLNEDISNGTAYYIFLVPEGIQALRPTLIQALQRSARVVTYMFTIHDLIPTQVETYKGTNFYLYTHESIVISS